MTALTTYGSAAAATTLATAGKMFNTTGGTSGNTSTKVGTTTQFKQIWSLGTTTTQSGVASIPAPTDSNFHGWMWDVTTLEGQEIAAGTWTPTFHLLSSSTPTVTPTVQWFVRSSAGVYTSIGSVTGSSITLSSSAQLLVFTAPSLALMDFTTGDKLVMWLWVNQTAGGASTATISVVEATSTSTAGVLAGEAKTVTPGYAPAPVALSGECDGVGTLAGTFSLSTALTTTMAGVGTLSGTASFAISLMSYRTTVLVDGPQAYYRLDEASGTNAADSSGNANNGTYTATGLTLAQPGCLADDPTDTAVLFTSSSGKVTLPTALNANGLNALSVECWVIPTTTGPGAGSFYIIATGPNVGNNGYQFDMNSVPSLRFWIGNGTTLLAASMSNPFVAGQSYHIVGTYDGTNARLYINGVLKATSPTIIGPIINSGTPSINVSTTLFFPGTIDEYAIYPSVLSATQILYHYNLGSGNLLTGIGTLSGTLSTSSGGVALSGECDGIGTLSGILSLSTALTTTMAGIGTLSPTLSASLSLPATTIAGVGQLSSTLNLSTALARTLAGVGTLTGTLSANTSLSDTFAGIGTLSGTLSANTALSTTLAGVGTLTGTLSTTGGVSLSVTFAGVGTLAGTFTLTTALSTTLAGIGTLTGTLSAKTALTTSLVGVSTLAGTTQLSTALTDTLVGVGTLSGTPSRATALSTTMSGVGTLSGTLSASGNVALAVTLAGVGTMSGALSANTALTDTLAGMGALAGTLTAQIALMSTLSGTGTLSGVFTIRIALFLTFAGIGTLAGTITLPISSYLSALWMTRDGKATWTARDNT